MSFLYIAWILFLTFLLAVFAFNCCTRKHSDTSIWTLIGTIITVLALIVSISEPATHIHSDSTAFYIWNRSSRDTSKAGWQITDYRKPNPHLPPNEYMMGVELARSNACSQFNFKYDADIDRFNRCAHFFPEFKPYYNQHLEQRIGICLP